MKARTDRDCCGSLSEKGRYFWLQTNCLCTREVNSTVPLVLNKQMRAAAELGPSRAIWLQGSVTCVEESLGSQQLLRHMTGLMTHTLHRILMSENKTGLNLIKVTEKTLTDPPHFSLQLSRPDLKRFTKRTLAIM